MLFGQAPAGPDSIMTRGDDGIAIVVAVGRSILGDPDGDGVGIVVVVVGSAWVDLPATARGIGLVVVLVVWTSWVDPPEIARENRLWHAPMVVLVVPPLASNNSRTRLGPPCSCIAMVGTLDAMVDIVEYYRIYVVWRYSRTCSNVARGTFRSFVDTHLLTKLFSRTKGCSPEDLSGAAPCCHRDMGEHVRGCAVHRGSFWRCAPRLSRGESFFCDESLNLRPKVSRRARTRALSRSY